MIGRVEEHKHPVELGQLRRKNPNYHPINQTRFTGRGGEEGRKWRLLLRLREVNHFLIRVLPGSPMVNATLSTLLLSNAWKNLTRKRVNAKNILMFTKNARKRRGKLDWSAIGIDPCSRETCLKNY